MLLGHDFKPRPVCHKLAANGHVVSHAANLAAQAHLVLVEGRLSSLELVAVNLRRA